MRFRGLAVALVALVLAGCSASPGPTPRTTPERPALTAPSSPAPHPAPTGEPLVVAALGDSLSRGFDACARWGDCPEASWTTGTDPRVDSIADRLGAATGRPVTRVNVARSGAESDDLDRQTAAALAERPDVVTLLIGANDVCRATVEAMTPTAVVADRVAASLDRIARDAPDAVVLVASVPDVTALLGAAADDATARFLWERTGGCATVLQDPRSTTTAAELRRAAVRARIGEYDAALRAACAQHPRCVDDDGALTAYRPELRQLSALDYFHPSVAGQAELADIEWAALRRSGLLAPR